ISSYASLFRFATNPQAPFADLLFYHLLQRGVYIWEGRVCYISTAHTDEDCAHLVRVFRDSIRSLREGGFLPEKAGSIVSSERSTSFPLTQAQRQIWVHSQFGDDASRAYNHQIVFGLRGRLDIAALREAVGDLISHHDSLRTVFDPSGDLQHIR